MRRLPDNVFDILLDMQRDGLIELDEDEGTFEPVDDTDRTWMDVLMQRFHAAGLNLCDLTRS
jgi:hypothetical protein